MYLMFPVKRIFGHPGHLFFISSLLSSGDYSDVIIPEKKTTQ
jgi:hypothetical protein